jgi:hypothetical protein
MIFDAIPNRTWELAYGALSDPELPTYVRALKLTEGVVYVQPITEMGEDEGEALWIPLSTISYFRPLRLPEPAGE